MFEKQPRDQLGPAEAATEAQTRGSQLHRGRLAPGSGEGQRVAGQERPPGDPLATTATVPAHVRTGLPSGGGGDIGTRGQSSPTLW